MNTYTTQNYSFHILRQVLFELFIYSFNPLNDSIKMILFLFSFIDKETEAQNSLCSAEQYLQGHTASGRPVFEPKQLGSRVHAPNHSAH